MRVFVTAVIGSMDHPGVECMDEDGVPSLTVKLTEEVMLMGDDIEVRRWVRELAAGVAATEP